MPQSASRKPKVFISYSHRDVRWRDMLVHHLRTFERQELIEIWDTHEIDPGAVWSEAISAAVKEADIAVLLISADFLASEFISEKELPLLLAQHRAEDLVVLPAVVRPALWMHVPGLAETRFLNDPTKPLSSLGESERDVALASIAARIVELAEAIRLRKNQGADHRRTREGGVSRGDGLSESRAREFFISHARGDGDFAELLKLKLQQKGYRAWIDTDRLGPGVDWRNEIDEAIKRAAAVIAIMSAEARESEYVTYEWAFAWGAGITVIPLMLRETPLHPRLATLQYLDFTNRIARPWDRLLVALDDLAPRGKSHSAPSR
jgi:hypothetical protein